ncbi:hydrolase [Clostridium sp. E02]|uniref:XkdQ/YqbQ family protein n=1 Tax=Clostridium sp. E02 TaxID=2487134 RepID=UPI000F531CCB|nr:hydrolase [Clostridium sp. E02]
MEVHLYIQNDQTVYEPVVKGNITWENNQRGQPGKCTFTLIPDRTLKIEEGNALRLDVEGKSVFFGFIFERNWNSDGQVKITAYDQLRYLKNKDTYNYTDLTAGELIQMIASDYHLEVGELEDTKEKLSRNEKDKTLFDIIQNNLDLTMIHKKEKYIFYDEVGKLTLKNMGNMKLDLLIDPTTAQDYDYKVSIDSNTYNQIKLYYDDTNTKKRELYITKNSENINRWGVLQKDETIDQGADGQAIAEMKLEQYNKPTRTLTIKDAFGDVYVRSGCLIPVSLGTGDRNLKNYLIIDSVTHKINEGIHTMDLILKGEMING